MTASLPTATRYVWTCDLCKREGVIAAHSLADREHIERNVAWGHRLRSAGCHSVNNATRVTYKPEKESE